MVTGICAVSLTTLTFSVGVMVTPLMSRDASCPAPSTMVLPAGFSPPSACRAMMPCALTSCLRHALRPAGDCLASSATSVRMDALNRLMSLVEAASVLSVCLRLACVASLIPSDCGTIAAASSPLKAGSALLNVFRSVMFSHGDCSTSVISASTTAGSELSFRQTSRLRSAYGCSIW